MATVAKPKRKPTIKKEARAGGIKAALTRKFGPLPAWAWLAGFALVALWWRRSHSTASSSSAGTSDAAGVTGGGGSGSSGGGGSDSGSGGGGDSGATPATTGASLTDASTNSPAVVGGGFLPLAFQTMNVPRGTSQPLNPGADPFSRMVGGALVQPLLWDGQTFYSQAAFQAWAKAHGTSADRIFATHPQAKSIYGQLASAPSGSSPAKSAVASGSAAKASSSVAASKSVRSAAAKVAPTAHRVAKAKTKKPKAHR